MDIKIAAEKMKPLIREAGILPKIHPHFGHDHLLEMADKIISGEVAGEKGHRWLGWIQGCVCVGGGVQTDCLTSS